MDNHMSSENKSTLKGKVISGLGQGAYFTQLEWVRQQCIEKLNFAPFTGTLNLEMPDESLEEITRLKQREGVTLTSPDAEFCSAICYPVDIDSIRAAIIAPQADHFTDQVHPHNVIEIIAPVSIKTALSIDDGSELSIKIEE